MEPKKKPNWYLLTGFLIGLAIGLAISVFLLPAEYEEALPAGLSEAGKADYRGMIALAFSANQDLERALSRLELLEDPDPVGAMTLQAQAMLASGESEAIARALAELATRLGQYLSPTQ